MKNILSQTLDQQDNFTDNIVKINSNIFIKQKKKL